MKKITIGGKEYTFEFSIEASMYADCTESITELFMHLGTAEDSKDVKGVLNTIANIPKTAMTLFYAGLLEHHSDAITGMPAAKELLKQYLVEHKEDGGDFPSVMNEMVSCMDDDGFFDLIGLTKMMKEAAQTEKTPKTPQDHKKKATKK